MRERLSSKKGFVWLKREITPQQQREIHRLGIPGVGFLTENKRVYPNGPVVSHEIGHVNIDNQGIAGIEKWLDGQGLAALHMAGLATDRLQRPVQLALDLRVQFALRDELVKAREKFKAKASSGVIAQRQYRRDRRAGVGARLRSQQSARGQRSDPHQPAHHRRLRDGLDLQGAHRGDGARFRQGDARRRCSTRAIRCITGASPSTITTPSTACCRCRKFSPIPRTSAPRAWRSPSASPGTRRF